MKFKVKWQQGLTPTGKPKVTDENFFSVCTMPAGTGSDLANAKLIAAAPELLEAASEALELLNAMRMTGNVTALKGTIDKLQAAISKALK